VRRSLVALVLLAATAIAAASAATAPTLNFSVFAQTDLPLGQAYWTGREWLWNAENEGKIEAADATGRNVRVFAAFDQGGEEMRCAVPPNKLWPDGVYCHTPDNRVVRFNRDGSNMTQLAKLPVPDNSDGGLAFDDAGRFGYALLVSSGGSGSDGGQVFAIRKDGRVQAIGSYPGPGGAENIAIAPARFGTAGGWCLISIDQDHVMGRVLAIDPKGTVKVVASNLGNGLNPIVVVKGAHPSARSGTAAGFYVADTISKAVYFAPLGTIAEGTVVVGTELTADFWAITPTKSGFSAVPVATDLPRRDWNLEGSAYVP
jgi:hypothetical protein